VAQLAQFVNKVSEETSVPVGFKIQQLKNGAVVCELNISICKVPPKSFRASKQQKQSAEEVAREEERKRILQALDGLTSVVILNGGSVSVQESALLDQISKHLFERMGGRAGFSLQMKLKECYDPSNVLYRDDMFKITKRR